jgi:D-3-phosphoglycerate dehydrogenase / 2-oxoglutarate reductase
MKIAVIHDYADVFRTTRAYQRLQRHDVVVHTDAYTDPARVVEQVAGCEAVLLTQQRVPVTREIVARLPDLRFISQTSANVYHIDLAACTEHGVVVRDSFRACGPGETTWQRARAIKRQRAQSRPSRTSSRSASGSRLTAC